MSTNKSKSVKELETERDMYYHLYMSSKNDRYSSESDKDEGYPSNYEFLMKYNSVNAELAAKKSRS